MLVVTQIVEDDPNRVPHAFDLSLARNTLTALAALDLWLVRWI